MIEKFSAAAFAMLAWTVAPAAQAQDGTFEGFYAGGEVSHHNVIAGADVAGVDVLEQDSVIGLGAFAGYRRQLPGGIVLGGEVSAGWEDADLRYSNPPPGITYDNGFYWRYGGLVGLALNDDTLAYVYVHETSRNFDVTINNSVHQEDEQGLLGYGLGVEFLMREIGPYGMLLRARVGTSHGNFDAPRNIDPSKPVDVSIGLAFQH